MESMLGGRRGGKDKLGACVAAFVEVRARYSPETVIRRRCVWGFVGGMLAGCNKPGTGQGAGNLRNTTNSQTEGQLHFRWYWRWWVGCQHPNNAPEFGSGVKWVHRRAVHRQQLVVSSHQAAKPTASNDQMLVDSKYP